MRKTRLVILPTKCLHQMGFLLLFLSCPVIGDWGRIRPESENSHNAIQIEREGTCGLERDPPGGLLDFLNENGSKQCRTSENGDSSTPVMPQYTRRSTERQVELRRIDQQRTVRASERRDERDVRRITQRRVVDQRRDMRRESERRVRRDVRSRSVEARRSTLNNDVRVRSLSLSRLDNERVARKQRSLPVRNTRQDNYRRENERLHLTRRMNERQNERRTDQDRRENREQRNERRENERTLRMERSRRETTRLSRTPEGERRDSRREKSFSESPKRRENDMTRRQIAVRERSETRLSLARRESTERTERARVNSERRSSGNERRESTVRIARTAEREIDTRRFAMPSPKQSERRYYNEKIEGMKPPVKAEEGLTEEVTKWMDLTSPESFKAGDWTTNCVVGAVVYFLTTRQVKTV